MKMALITKIFRFEAAHNLPGHRGKCAHLHGHSYRLEATLRGPLKNVPQQSDHGMVVGAGAGVPCGDRPWPALRTVRAAGQRPRLALYALLERRLVRGEDGMKLV